LVEITDLKPLKILNSLRWTGKAKFPGALRGRSIVVFQVREEILAIPAFCPHEQANLAEAAFVSPYVIECPLHQNRYDLRTGVISTFEVELRDDKMYLVWNKKKNEAQPHKFAFEVPVELRSAQERIATLESELVALSRAAELREQDTKSTVRQMELMILEVEQKSEALTQANQSLVAANEFINRVTNAMREVLIVLDTQGHVTDANRRFYDLLGYLPEEVRGRGIERLMSEGTWPLFWRARPGISRQSLRQSSSPSRASGGHTFCGVPFFTDPAVSKRAWLLSVPTSERSGPPSASWQQPMRSRGCCLTTCARRSSW
jgi:nitrite reductase/ring-hydroxylating ferredoxin subunit